MVLIRFKAQFVSLFITVMSGFAELCLFAAALGFNRYAECQALRQGRPVSVRYHRIRTRFLAIFAMVVFIVLEVIMSFFSDPDFSRTPERRPCVSVARYDLIDGQVFDVYSNSVLINCIRAENQTVFQRVGNRSRIDGDFRCSKSALYKYSGEGVINANIGPNVNRNLICAPSPRVPNNSECVYSELRNNELLISISLLKSDIDPPPERTIPFLQTELLFNISKDQESVLAARALDAYFNDITDPLELRRRILTSSENSECRFDVLEDATQVPRSLIIIAVITWALSFLAFFSTFLFKRQIFYDMGDPLHWAQRTHRNIDEPITSNPVVTSVYEHGERLMYVSSSSSEEFDFLRRVKTGLRERVMRRVHMNRSHDDVSRQPDESVEEQI